MSYMFYFASSFNQPVNFDTSSVTSVTGMFYRVTDPQYSFTTSVDNADMYSEYSYE